MNVQRKVMYGVIAGAIIAVMMWIARLILGRPVPITPEEYGALQTVVVLVVQWWVRNHPDSIPSDDAP
jgi:hypothetical protein